MPILNGVFTKFELKKFGNALNRWMHRESVDKARPLVFFNLSQTLCRLNLLPYISRLCGIWVAMQETWITEGISATYLNMLQFLHHLNWKRPTGKKICAKLLTHWLLVEISGGVKTKGVKGRDSIIWSYTPKSTTITTAGLLCNSAKYRDSWP